MSPSSPRNTGTKRLSQEIIACQKCPRLRQWCQKVSCVKRRAYQDQPYCGKPILGFGVPNAPIFVVGLAPGAHGANRTGRVFTGDLSGDWLYRALHKAGLANQARSQAINDGLRLRQTYVTAVVRCAPPANKPTPQERDRCLPFLVRELAASKRTRVIVALGAFAWQGVLLALGLLGHESHPKPKFGHLAKAFVGPYLLIGSYHPSQQNTFTKRLTEDMFDAVFAQAKVGAEL